MSVAIRGLNDLKRHRLAHFLYFGRIVFASDQPLDSIERICRIGDGLTLGDLPDQSFVLVRKTDNGRCGSAALFVGNNLHRSAFEYGYAAVCCAQINSDYFAHLLNSFSR